MKQYDVTLTYLQNGTPATWHNQVLAPDHDQAISRGRAVVLKQHPNAQLTACNAFQVAVKPAARLQLVS